MQKIARKVFRKLVVSFDTTFLSTFFIAVYGTISTYPSVFFGEIESRRIIIPFKNKRPTQKMRKPLLEPIRSAFNSCFQ